MGFSAVQSLSCVRLFATPWTAAGQASLYFTTSWSLFRLMANESTMSSNHLILCCPLFFLTLIFPSIRVFSSKSVLHIKWPEYQSFSFSISPSNEYSGLISFRIYWLDLLAVQGILGRKNQVSNVRLVFCLSISFLRNQQNTEITLERTQNLVFPNGFHLPPTLLDRNAC